ncbi:MAG: type II toxin-antitoxin system VapC family toxin [Microcystis panniformis]
MLKVLIDTHVFLWYVTNNKQLRDNHKIMINERENQVYLSQASIWEMAIKYSLRKLTTIRTIDKKKIPTSKLITKDIPKHNSIFPQKVNKLIIILCIENAPIIER